MKPTPFAPVLALLLAAPILTLPALAKSPLPPSPAALREGDRVVWLGDAWVEREARYGYVEAALVAGHPELNLVFRNLGWSADTPWGHSQSYFGPPAEGFTRREAFIKANRPTVAWLSFGGAAAFDGAAGLSDFTRGMTHLTDSLKPLGLRAVVVTSPMPHERVSDRLPDPEPQNQRIALYRDELKRFALERSLVFSDWHEALNFQADPRHAGLRHTDNGMHLDAFGYWCAGPRVAHAVGAIPDDWAVTLPLRDPDGLRGTTLSELTREADRVAFTLLDRRLPQPPMPSPRPDGAERLLPTRKLIVGGLAAGNWALTVDGKALTSATAEQWAAGVGLPAGPEAEQAEALRRTIVKKNQLYFHRWRPANETYLHGFRKHEQGRNAAEMPQFEPLVAEQEGLIAGLRRPQPRRYVLTRTP